MTTKTKKSPEQHLPAPQPDRNWAAIANHYKRQRDVLELQNIELVSEIERLRAEAARKPGGA